MKKLYNSLILCFLFAVLFFLFVPMSVWHTFGDIEFESVVFHFYMPKAEMSFDWVGFICLSVLTTIISSLFLFLIYLKLDKLKKTIFLYMLFLLFCFDFYYLNVWSFIKNQYESSDFIENYYVNPKQVKIVFPKEKQNLIFIVAESLETTFQDKKNGGIFDVNYIPQLTDLAKNNVNFSPSVEVGGGVVLPGSGWTIAGLIAQTAGIPLKTYKVHKISDPVGNGYDKYDSFLSNTVSLGDILNQNGYQNYFILGSSQKFSGQDIYMKSHGDFQIYDQSNISSVLGDENIQTHSWGLFDEFVYRFSKNKLMEISKSQKPFLFVLQTIDSHREGFLSKKCSQKHDELIQNVYSCVSSQLNDFISWCMKQDFFKNTTIIISGDHCNMSDIAFKKDINEETGLYEGIERQVYNVFINPVVKPKKEKNRLFSTMDMFPTILGSIGVSIEGERLGLGTNLFSDSQTLLEQYGYNYLYDELRKKSNFYNRELLYPK